MRIASTSFTHPRRLYLATYSARYSSMPIKRAQREEPLLAPGASVCIEHPPLIACGRSPLSIPRLPLATGDEVPHRDTGTMRQALPLDITFTWPAIIGWNA